jgi:hypothetical protein
MEFLRSQGGAWQRVQNKSRRDCHVNSGLQTNGSQRRKPLSAVSAALALSACAHAELNLNTVDVAVTVESLYKEQALNNLSRLIDDPNILPSQADIASGNVQTQDQLSGTGQFPWGSQVVSGGNFMTGITQITAAARQLTVGLTGNRTQSWSITPITDPASLQRLRAVYVHAINRNNCNPDLQKFAYCIDSGIDADRRLIDRYIYNLNVIASNDNITIDSSRVMEPQCVLCLDRKTISDLQTDKRDAELKHLIDSIARFNANHKDDKIDKQEVAKFKARQSLIQNIMQNVQQQIANDFVQSTSNTFQIPFDRILASAPHVNSRLHKRWLYWNTDNITVSSPQERQDIAPSNPPPGGPENAHSLGHYGHHELLMAKDDYNKGIFADFLLFLMPQADPRLPAPSTSGGGGGGGGGGGSPGGGASGGGKSGK